MRILRREFWLYPTEESWYLPGMKASSTEGPKQWQVYLLECSDRTLYCGVTTDLEARIAHHNSGNASKYTRSRLPVTCVAASPFLDKSRAFSLEYRVKRLPRDKKKRWVEKGCRPEA